MSWYSDLFAVDDAEDVVRERAVAQASEVLDVVDKPYFRRLMAYLDEETDKPVITGEKLAESAVRSNTFKEFRAKIRRDIRDAQSILEEVKHGR